VYKRSNSIWAEAPSLHRFLAHKIGSSQSKVAFWLVGLTVLVLFLFLAKPFLLVCGESHILLDLRYEKCLEKKAYLRKVLEKYILRIFWAIEHLHY
jgi:hypothetical protein